MINDVCDIDKKVKIVVCSFYVFCAKKYIFIKMGIFTSCCKPSASEVLTPDSETRRRQQVEAAERRAAQEAARGVKDPSKVLRNQQRSEEMEKREQELNMQGGANLRWTSG